MRYFGALAAFTVMGLVACQPSTSVTADSPAYTIQTQDADRFAALFVRADGAPTSEDIQTGYLDGAGRGVEVFTPDRIVDAQNLAQAIANNLDRYQRAIDRCLPIVKGMNGELNEIYTAMSDLFPGREMPSVHAVFGAGNSGGTATPDTQVIGIETICNGTDADIMNGLRGLFAHETVHSLQGDPDMEAFGRDPLLFVALMEGVADYIALQVSDDLPRSERDIWASARAEQVRADFMADRDILLAAMANGESFDDPTPEMVAAYQRWFANYGNAPEGWPSELGYWVGRQIATGYAERAGEDEPVLETLLEMEDPQAILDASGY